MSQTTELTTADLANAASGQNRQEIDPQRRGTEPQRPEDQYAGPLFSRDFSDDMRSRWENIQAGFVDDPQASVKEADGLVAMAIKRLAESFAEERAKLEQQWSSGNDVSTEDLRQGLRRYRAFFQRLLSV